MDIFYSSNFYSELDIIHWENKLNYMTNIKL